MVGRLGKAGITLVGRGLVTGTGDGAAPGRPGE
jgi:hypothetical protein